MAKSAKRVGKTISKLTKKFSDSHLLFPYIPIIRLLGIESDPFHQFGWLDITCHYSWVENHKRDAVVIVGIEMHYIWVAQFFLTYETVIFFPVVKISVDIFLDAETDIRSLVKWLLWVDKLRYREYVVFSAWQVGDFKFDNSVQTEITIAFS